MLHFSNALAIMKRRFCAITNKWVPEHNKTKCAKADDFPGRTARYNSTGSVHWLTFWVFADIVVLGVAVVIIPLEQEMAFFIRRCRRLVVQNHAHLTATRWLIPMPVPTLKEVNSFII